MDFTLDQKIGQMVMTGFRGDSPDDGSLIIQHIKKYHLGGVWLTDNDSPMQETIGNISSPKQVKSLTQNLQEHTDIPLFIAIDAEGGQVIRLKQKYGFPKTYSARKLGQKDDPDFTYQQALKIAYLLKDIGINFNFSPVLDLDIHPESPALGQKERCFSSDPEKIRIHAEQVIKAHHQNQILSCLKHFPGHGSTMDDSHHGFVDATESWDEKEIKPYQYFIDNNMVDAILTAHIFIKDFDESHPATLSRSIITDLLRRRMGYEGVVISDDLNMGAIRLNYNYADAVELAVNAGVDIILNSNVMQYNANIAEITFQTIKDLVEKGRISKARIDESFSRIMKLKRNLS